MIAELQREVRDHEPLQALSPGPDGLSMIRRLLEEAPAFIKNNGHMILEIGFDQGEAVKQLVDSSVWNLREIRPDLQGIPRIVVLQKRYAGAFQIPATTFSLVVFTVQSIIKRRNKDNPRH